MDSRYLLVLKSDARLTSGKHVNPSILAIACIVCLTAIPWGRLDQPRQSSKSPTGSVYSSSKTICQRKVRPAEQSTDHHQFKFSHWNLPHPFDPFDLFVTVYSNSKQFSSIRMNISSPKLLISLKLQLSPVRPCCCYRPGDWAILKPEASKTKKQISTFGMPGSEAPDLCWPRKSTPAPACLNSEKIWTSELGQSVEFFWSTATSQVLRWIVGEVLRLCEVSFGNDGAFLHWNQKIYCLRAG